MTDPKRLIDCDELGSERQLLLLAASERAPEAVRDRVEAHALAVAALGGAVGVAAGSGAAAGKTGSTLGVLVLKWLSLGAVAGGVTALAGSEVALRWSAPARETPAVVEAGPVAAPARALGATAPRVAEEPEPAAVEPVPAAPAAHASAKRATGQVEIGPSSTLVEAQSLARIRKESTRDPAFALVLLDQHLSRFPDGAHAAEARQLRRELEARRSGKSNP